MKAAPRAWRCQDGDAGVSLARAGGDGLAPDARDSRNVRLGATLAIAEAHRGSVIVSGLPAEV